MAESFLANREILYLFRSDGCDACAAAEPEFTIFERKHPFVFTMKLDANGPLPDRLGIKIKATPTYVLRRGDQAVKREGTMTAKQIESWMKGAGAAL